MAPMTTEESKRFGRVEGKVEALTKMAYGGYAIGASILAAIAGLWYTNQKRMTRLETILELRGIVCVDVVDVKSAIPLPDPVPAPETKPAVAMR